MKENKIIFFYLKAFYIRSIVCLILLCFFDLALSEQIPRSVVSDKRIKLINYDPNNVVVLKSRYGYQTQIVFGPHEVVQNVSLGDSLAWQAVPVNNNLFIKPVAQSSTNMTVLTNENSYNFQLDSTRIDIIPTYKLQFIYPAGGYDMNGKSMAVGICDPKNINYKYSFTGNKALAPVAAYDCGHFTYFKFSQASMHHQPAIFVVDDHRKETLINYHMEGDYTVINSISKQYSLRDGDEVTSVYNDYLIGD